MYLELAERGKRKKVSVNGYKRKSTVQAHTRKYPSLSDGSENPYHVYIAPELNDGVGMFVREDYFDSLSESEFDSVMSEIELYEDGISGKGKARREARRARRTERKTNNTQKKKDKNERKNQRRKAKDDKKRMTAQAKLTKAERKGSTDWGSIVDSVGGVVGKFTGRGDSTEVDNTGGESGGDGVNNVSVQRRGSENTSDDTILGMPKTVVIIGGVALLGLGIFAMTKNKK